jgi:hypothetical protein
MTPIDSLRIGTVRPGGLTMEELRTFVDKHDDKDCALRFNYELSNNEVAVYELFLHQDMCDAPELKIDPDFRWEIAERVPHLRRAKNEALKDWHIRFDESARGYGYIVDKEGEAQYAITLHHKGAKYQTDDKARRTHYLAPGDQWLPIYQFPKL